jgi:hypothetical protein
MRYFWFWVLICVLATGCTRVISPSQQKDLELTGELNDPNLSYVAPKIATAEAGRKYLDQDIKPTLIDPNLGKGAHQTLIEEAYDTNMQRHFKLPPKVEDDYAIETIEASVYLDGQQYYLHINIQTNEVALESTAPTLPNSLTIGPAPLGVLFSESGSLTVNTFVKYEIGLNVKTHILKDIYRILDFFPMDTVHNRFQEGQNLTEIARHNYFNVLLHGITPKTQLKLGARQTDQHIFLYARLPTGRSDQLTLFRYTLTPESELQYPVIYFPMTHAQWLRRATQLPQNPVSDLKAFPFIDPHRSLEQKLVYQDLKGVLELSTAQLDDTTRTRILSEIQDRPHLLFVLVALTNTSQVVMSDITCESPLYCRSIGDLATIVNDHALVLNHTFFTSGNTIEDMVAAIVKEDRDTLHASYKACYGNEAATNFQAKLRNLKKIKSHQSKILKSLSTQINRSLASEKKLSGKVLRDKVRKNEISRALSSLDKNITDLESALDKNLTDTFLNAGDQALSKIENQLKDFSVTAYSIESDTSGQAKDACTSALEPAFRRMQLIEAERIRMITETIELPEYFLSQVNHDQFAYQLDLIPTVDLPISDISYEGKVIGKKSPLFNTQTMGDLPHNGLRVAFAIRNSGTVSIDDAQGQSRSVPKLSFVDQRANDLKNVSYAFRTLVFILESPRSFFLAMEWIKTTYPNLKLSELIIDTHGQNGTIVLGDTGSGARWLNVTNIEDALQPLIHFPKTKTFNLFINACLVALDGGFFARALNFELAPESYSTVLAADENYKVSVRQTKNFKSQPGTSFTFQYTHGQLFVHEKKTGEGLTKGGFLFPTAFAKTAPMLDGSDFVFVKKPLRFYSGNRSEDSPTREPQSLFNISRMNLNSLFNL